MSDKTLLLREIKKKAKGVKVYQTIKFSDFELKGKLKERKRKRPDLRMQLFDLDVKDKLVYDLGCSNGYFCYEFAKRGARVIGVDKNKEVLELNKLIAKYYELDIEFIEDDLSDIDFYRERMKECDIAIFCSVIHHFFARKIIDPISFCRQILSEISKKTNLLFFESGQNGEPFNWSTKLNIMGMEPQNWILKNWLNSTEFRKVEVINPLGFNGLLGNLRKFVSTTFRKTESMPQKPHLRMVTYLLYKLFIKDPRETRYIFVCHR